MRILTGIQPSGTPHLGNYFGMMKPTLELAEKNTDVFIFVADLHALTTIQNAKAMRENTINVVLDFLALGLDPNKITFYRQSDVAGHTDLAWILSCLSPMGLLERCHSYKDKTARGIDANVGLFYYPVLMAADILLYDADVVPVGKDQKQHVEVTRDLAQKFNNTYGDTFVIPDVKISEETAVVPGIDGQKMSKSYGNTIEIFADDKVIEKKIMSIVTDSKGIDEEKDPNCSLVMIAKLFMNKDEISNYLQGGVGNGDFKKALAEKVNNYFRPFKEKREKLAEEKDKIKDILKNGAEKAQQIATEKIEEVRKKVGLKLA